MSLKFNTDNEESEDLLSAALHVEAADNEDDDDRPPQDGMAYLRQVIKERKRVPDTVTADISKYKKQKTADHEPSKSSENDRTKARPPSGCCPSASWQRDQVSQFSEVRLKAERHAELGRRTGEVGIGTVKIPDKKNEAVWCHMILGGKVWREICVGREDDEAGSKASDVPPDEPKLSFVLSVPVHVCEHVLEYLVTWLSLTGWRNEYGPWIYSLLVRLEKPLTPDVGSLLRDLVLVSAKERKRIVNEVSDVEVKDESVAALNLIICLVAKYFGQTDLEDKDDD